MKKIAEAVEEARRIYLPLKGVIAVGSSDGKIVFYVESREDEAKIPKTFMGYPVEVKVVGKIIKL